MTVLGKILVFVNLVFSLVISALIVMVFATRTNWHAQNERLRAEVEVANKRAQAYLTDIEEVKKYDQAQMTDLRTKLKNAQDDIVQAQGSAKTLADSVNAKDKNSQVTSVAAEKATEETARLRSEVKGLQETVGLRDKKVGEQEGAIKDLNEKKTLAEIAFQSEHERLKQLLDQVASLSQELERAKTKGGVATATAGFVTEGAAQQPAPADLRGKVLGVDPKSGFVTVSAGSDSGLNKGHVLEVFRTWPEPKYLGKIRIVATSPHEAVGRPVNGLRAALIKKDDDVAANIIGPH